MLFDVNTLFSGSIASDGTRSAQAITATAVSTNVLDLRQPGGAPTLKNEGVVGQNIYLVVVVAQTFNTLTSLTITFETDSTTNLATSPTVHVSRNILLAGLTAGTTLMIPLPVEATYERYAGVRYTVTGSNPTLGSVYAFLSLDPQANVGYPAAFTLDV